MGLTPVPQQLVLLSAAVTWRFAIGQSNLLMNPSFEDDLRGTWFSNGFDISRETADVPHGNFALKCSNRVRDADGPITKNLQFIKGRHYGFEGYVKLLHDVSGKPWQTVKAVVQIMLPGDILHAYNIAYRSFCDTSQGWFRLKGDIEAPQIDFTDARLVLRGPDPGTDFLLDNLTFYELPENPTWRMEADTNIETHRKSNIKIKIRLPPGVPASEVDVQVALRRHWFAFGTLLRDDLVREHPNSDLMKLVYYLFDWASVQSFKWKYNKGIPPDTNPDFNNAIEATDILRANGMKVRGHSILWDVEKNVPDWVKTRTGDDLRATIHTHLAYMINLARGKLEQWDVQNEYIAGHYYENALNDPNVTKQLYVQARALYDTAELYMNEFQSITSGAQTEQYYDIVTEFLKENIPLDGLGIQGHVKEYIRPDPTAMWRRIDRLAKTRLDLMMTEFDLGWPNKIERADWFEDAIRAFFGHPAMRGVILWDFWNETMKTPDHELVEGPDLKIVEAGQRWACLVKKEWTTNETFNLGTAGTTLNLRGFRGDYVILVKRNGVPVQRKFLALRKNSKTLRLVVTASTAEIAVTPEFDYVPKCISHRAERSLGIRRLSSTRAFMKCRTVMSSTSGPGGNDATSVGCDADELMTGCSSYHTDRKWTRNGEKMEIDPFTGKAQCTAYNGINSPKGVKAYARCCRVKGMKCDYRTAGPSFPFDGAMAEANCSARYVALGCSSYAPYPHSDGVRPDDTLTSCLAQSGPPGFTKIHPAFKSGVYVYTACCKTNKKFDCKVESSMETTLTAGGTQGVTCPARYVMTGCNAFAESGYSAGARIVVSGGVEKCRVVLGAHLPAGSSGVRAYATCCRAYNP